MMAGPVSPGVARYWYQPAGASVRNGGTAMVPSSLRPSVISGVLTPLTGMSSRVGADRVRGTGPLAARPLPVYGAGDTSGAGGPWTAARLVAEARCGTSAGRPPIATRAMPALAS